MLSIMDMADKIYLKIGGSMKTKKFRKKLTLKKKTIAHLDRNKIKDVYGGAPQTTETATFFLSCPLSNCCTDPPRIC
jgi:hypothetical protein